MKKTYWLTPLLITGMALSFTADAAVLTLNNVVLQQVVSDSPDTTYGGCYAVLDKAVGTGCTGKTVSFDCAGKFNTNGTGNRHYSTALLAFSLNKPVNIVVNPANKYNGFCVASRVSLLK